MQSSRHSTWGPRVAFQVHRKEPARPSHLVRRCLSLLAAQGKLLVIGKHDQANEAAYAEHDLLAGEHRIAGTTKEARVGEEQ